MDDVIQQVKARSRAVWSAGDWDDISNFIAAVGPVLLDRVGIEQGMDVLDVGTGSGGTVAIPAAQRGANVTGSDLVGEHFEAARRRAAAAGVEVRWVEADAEELPFPGASFDRVLSTFGHMFAPQQAVTAAEMARVLKPGGVLGTCTWTPEGVNGEMFGLVGKYMPPPPAGISPPIKWGSEDHVRELFEPHGLRLEFSREMAVFETEDMEEYMSRMSENFGPWVMARQALGDRWPELEADFRDLMERSNKAKDGVRFEAEYLLTVGLKAA
jgi:ubiquinone/menaquinone biosynthesis C-methylase UbiE